MPQTITATPKAGFSLAIALILVTAYYSYWNTAELIEANRLVMRSQQVLDAVDDTYSAMKDADWSERTYVASGDETSLKEFADAIRQAQVQAERIRPTMPDNPVQKQRAALLLSRVGEQLALQRTTLQLKKEENFRDTQRAVGRRQMADIRAIVDQFDAEEIGLLEAQTMQAHKTARSTVYTLVALLLLSLTIIGGALAMLLRDVKKRELAEAESRDANLKLASFGELEARTNEISFLNEVSSVLQICITPDEANSAITMFMQRLYPDSSGKLALINNSRDILEIVAEWGSAKFDRVFTPDECYALRTGRMYLREKKTDKMICKHLEGEGIDRYVCIPMMAKVNRWEYFMCNTAKLRPSPMKRVTNSNCLPL